MVTMIFGGRRDFTPTGDHVAIERLILGYAHHMDRKEWPQVEALLDPDAHVEYRVVIGTDDSGVPQFHKLAAPRGREVGAFLAQARSSWAYRHHAMSNIVVDGDTARSENY
jgi:hypothetical protein